MQVTSIFNMLFRYFYDPCSPFLYYQFLKLSSKQRIYHILVTLILYPHFKLRWHASEPEEYKMFYVVLVTFAFNNNTSGDTM